MDGSDRRLLAAGATALALVWLGIRGADMGFWKALFGKAKPEAASGNGLEEHLGYLNSLRLPAIALPRGLPMGAGAGSVVCHRFRKASHGRSGRGSRSRSSASLT